MKNLSEYISEASNDKYAVIQISREVCEKIIKAGMGFTHKDDEFYIYKDGRIVYSNPYLFSISFQGKIPKIWLGKVIPLDDKRVLKLQPHPWHTNGNVLTPYNYIKAVLNAYASGNYEKRGDVAILTDIEYTRDDYDEDKEA